jgi:hypothetical protein
MADASLLAAASLTAAIFSFWTWTVRKRKRSV